VAVNAQHPLDSWVRRTVSGSIQNLSSVAFGNGVFVGVGDSSAVVRSTNGVDWSVTTAGSYGNLARVRFLNGEFVAVGTSDKIISSTDGISWTATTLPQAGFRDVAFGNDVYVIAGAATYMSSNGVDWIQTHPIVVPIIFPNYETPLDTVLFSSGRFIGLAAGGSAPGGLGGRPSLYSTNGVDWVIGGIGPSGDTGERPNCELLSAEGIVLATSDSSRFPGAVNGANVSTNNGASWCCRFNGLGLGEGGGALAFGQGEYIWVQNYIGLQVYSSSNGFSWALRYHESITAAGRSAAFGHGSFVVAGIDDTGAGYILQSGNLGGTPTIFQEPADRSAVVDNPAAFSVQAVGAPVLEYQWYKGSNIIAGATNASYSIDHVSTSDIGGYQVVVANSFGSVTSRVAQLTVAFLDINCYAGVKVLGVPGRTYRIESSPASGTPDWQVATNIVLPYNPYIWIDYGSPAAPSRIYRAAELP